jgi:SAM-dependent methyltransferase
MKSVLLSKIRRFWDNPYLHVWIKFLDSMTPPTPVVADVGGGEGGLANYLAPKTKWVFILDKERTSKEGADNAPYAGSLTRAYKGRLYQNITPIKGDATDMPFADSSLDMIVSSELIEHLNPNEKELFFKECNRTLKKKGVLIISTPNADYIEKHRFWFPLIARTIIPKQLIHKLPGSLCGAWLAHSVEQWEANVGHYHRGCRINSIISISEKEGLEELKHRFLHTSLTSFWLQLMFTFPLFYMLLSPLVRFFYFIESNINKKDGVSFMIAFQKNR